MPVQRSHTGGSQAWHERVSSNKSPILPPSRRERRRAPPTPSGAIVAAGHLYYHLDDLRLYLPPLREREEDVVELARAMVARFAHEEGIGPRPNLGPPSGDSRTSRLGPAISNLAEAEGELAVRERERLDAEVVIQALRAFDEVFDHLTLDEKQVSKDEVEIELYEGRRASAMLAAFASGRGGSKTSTPDRVDRECVARWRWLPAHAQMRTRGRRDRPVFWLGVPLLLDRSRLKKKGKEPGSSLSKAPAKPSIDATRAKMQDLLDTGEVASRAELARHLKVSRAYVTQVLGSMVHAVHALEGEAPTRVATATHGGDT